MPLMQAVTDSQSGIIRQMDITAPEGEVQVQISADGKVLWVHVEGVTVLRVCRCEKITIENQNEELTMMPRSDFHDQLAAEYSAGYDAGQSAKENDA